LKVAGPPNFSVANGVQTFLALPVTAGKAIDTVSVANASMLEGREQFLANLAGMTNEATISNSEGNGSITDIVAALCLVIHDVKVYEARSVTMNVKPADMSAFPIFVNHITFDDTADSRASATLGFPRRSDTLSLRGWQAAGSTLSIIVPITADEIDEPSRTRRRQFSATTKAARSPLRSTADSQGGPPVRDGRRQQRDVRSMLGEDGAVRATLMTVNDATDYAKTTPSDDPTLSTPNLTFVSVETQTWSQ
jgi:hypothetical protein